MLVCLDRVIAPIAGAFRLGADVVTGAKAAALGAVDKLARWAAGKPYPA